MEKRKFYGEWWVATSEANKVRGTLVVFNNGKSELTLYGLFTNPTAEMKSSIFIKPLHFNLINGLTTYGQEITLIDCYISGEEKNVDGISKQTLNPSRVLLGVLLSDIADIKFDRMILNLAYLPEWFTNNSFRQKMNENENHVNEFSLTYSSPPKVKLAIEDFHITINRFLEKDEYYQKSIKLTQGANFIIDLNESYEVDYLLDNYVRPLRDLITFSTRVPSFINSLVVSSTKILNKPELIGDSSHLQIEVIFENSFFHVVPEERLSSDQFLIKYEDISNQCENFFKNWFRLYNQLRNVYAFLLAPVYNSNMYFQNIFFNLIQAVEGYHRTLLFDAAEPFFNQIDLDSRLYEEIKKQVIESFSEEESNWIKKKLQYNEPSLRKRILHLINYIRFKLGIEMPSKDFIAKRAAHYRNFLAHPHKNIITNDNVYKEIIFIENSLSSILKMNLLIELGLSKEFLNNLFDRKMKYSFEAIDNFMQKK